jgi:predicted acetyltransferase
MKINENRGDIVEIILDRVKEENKDVLYRLLEYSLFEESLNDGNEMNNYAIFEYKYFDLYFTDNERDAFFVKEKETNKLLGFVMINTYMQKCNEGHSIAEFMIIPKYRRNKIGKKVAFNKQIQLEKENWIITPNHHKAIISKEKFDKVQDILNRQAKVNKDGSIGILSGFLKCKCCGSNMIKRTSKGKVYYYCSNYYRNKTCENNKSISENGLIEIINEELNLINITRLELENKVKCIYIDKYKNVKIDFK